MGAEKPFSLRFGEVTGVNPLKIKIDQHLEVGEAFLVLTDAVRDYYVKLEAYDSKDENQDYHITEKQNQDHRHQLLNIPVTVTPSAGVANGITETQNADHDHNYKGGVFKVRLGLKQGEKVILLQVQGGQSYVVLDRVNPPEGTEGSA
jgi:hypothetical protein